MSAVDVSRSIDTRRHFLQALRRILRPIVRLLIRSGIRYDEFVDVARGAYVESAIRDTRTSSPRPTPQEVALRTSIPLQRVNHYLDDAGALPHVKPTITRVVAETLHKWHTDSQFVGPNGVPLELEFDGNSTPNFRDLVKQVNADTSPEAVMTQLLEAGSIEQSADGRVRARSRHFIWREGSVAGIENFGDAVALLMDTLEHNTRSLDASGKRLERSVFADKGLPQSLMSDFQSHARDRAATFLSDIDNWFAQFSDRRENTSDERVDAGVYVFLFTEVPVDTRPLEALVQSCWSPRISESGSDT